MPNPCRVDQDARHTGLKADPHTIKKSSPKLTCKIAPSVPGVKIVKVQFGPDDFSTVTNPAPANDGHSFQLPVDQTGHFATLVWVNKVPNDVNGNPVVIDIGEDCDKGALLTQISDPATNLGTFYLEVQ
jgi:hypothetical protein